MTAKGTSLPERLRSRAKVEHYQYKDMLTAAVMREAADELDRRAEEIQRKPRTSMRTAAVWLSAQQAVPKAIRELLEGGD